ncbi:MAG: aminotransferase class V-fold PLP-dependent enzyme [Acidimicrobiales bacterium]
MNDERTAYGGITPGLIAQSFPRRASGSYLDTAAIGLVPESVPEAVARCYEALSQGTRGSSSWRQVVEATAQEFADEFGVAVDDISFMASTGEAMNAIARAVDWHEGDEVLVLADDFPTVRLPWSKLGGGVRLVCVHPQPGDDRLGALLGSLSTRTRVVSAAQVCSHTGTRIDLQKLGAACAEVGALLVADGAQSAGVRPVDLRNVDCFIATGYKWLLAGFGVAVVVAKQSSLEGLEPTLLGHSNEPPSHRLQYGHVNLPGVYALHAAAEVRRQIGREAIEARMTELVGRIHAAALELALAPIGVSSELTGIVCLAGIPDSEDAARSLAAEGVFVASRQGNLRVSPYLYTSDQDVDRAIKALARLAETVHASQRRRANS